MTRLRSIGLFVSAAAATALLSAPFAFAEDGNGDRNRGHDADERTVVVAMNPAAPVVVEDRNDNDVNEDRDEVQAAPGQPEPAVVEMEQELNEDKD